MSWSINASEAWGVAIVSAFGLIPVVGATFLSFRSYRRRVWLLAPGLIFLTLVPLLAWLYQLVGSSEPDTRLGLALSVGAVFSGWIAAGLFLTALAIAGPRLPVIDVREVF